MTRARLQLLPKGLAAFLKLLCGRARKDGSLAFRQGVLLSPPVQAVVDGRAAQIDAFHLACLGRRGRRDPRPGDAGGTDHDAASKGSDPGSRGAASSDHRRPRGGARLQPALTDDDVTAAFGESLDVTQSAAHDLNVRACRVSARCAEAKYAEWDGAGGG